MALFRWDKKAVLLVLLLLSQFPFCAMKGEGGPKPIVPSTIAEAGRELPKPEIAERTHGFGQAIDGLASHLDGALKQIGEKAMGKLRELKLALPEKFQAMMEKTMEIFKKPSASEKEQWDKLIKSVESTHLSPDEKREFYEKVAAATVQQIH